MSDDQEYRRTPEEIEMMRRWSRGEFFKPEEPKPIQRMPTRDPRAEIARLRDRPKASDDLVVKEKPPRKDQPKPTKPAGKKKKGTANAGNARQS